MRLLRRWGVAAIMLVTACSPGQFDAPWLDDDVQADLAAQSVVVACGSACAIGPTYVVDQQAMIVTRGQGFPAMSSEMRTALQAELGSVEMIDWAQARQLIVDRTALAGASLVIIGAIEYIADYTAVVNLGVVTEQAGIDVMRLTYRWDRDHWNLQDAG